MQTIYCESRIPQGLPNTLVLLPDYFGSSYTYLWDDYGYKTTFKLRYVFEGKPLDLGEIKILFKDCDNSHKYITENSEKLQNGVYSVSCINSKNAVSIGADIDYYKILRKRIKKNRTINKILRNLSDVCFFSNNLDEYRTWEGFSISLLRDASDESILRKGYAIATGNYKPLKKFILNAVSPNGTKIDFSFDRQSKFQENLNAIIGKNGLGKSKTLKSIADGFLGLSGHNSEWPYFNRLIVVSFSPFENFITEKELIKSQSSSQEYSKEEQDERFERSVFVNDYSYIGLRSSDIHEDINLIEASKKSVLSLICAIKDELENGWLREYDKVELITSTLKLAMKFEKIAIKDIEENKLYFDKELFDLSRDISNPKKYLSGKNFDLVFLDDELNEIKLSSGQKIYSLLIPSLVNDIKEESLILFDEPELYLHPELEVGLITMLKKVLKETSSFGIVATHSAIIVREINRKLVHIMKSDGSIAPSRIETFGNSLDDINGYVFDDYNTPKPFQELLKGLLTKYESIDDAIKDLSGSLGDGALSYLLELKYERGNKDD